MTNNVQYECYLLKYHTSNSILKKINKSFVSILLSTLSKLPSEIITQLENMGIYDTDDFFNANGFLKNKLNLSLTDFNKINRYVLSERIRSSNIPVRNLIIPYNYAFLVNKVLGNEIGIGIFWHGLIMIYSTIISNKERLIAILKDLVIKCKNPELITVYSENKLEEIENMTFLNTYYSNFPTDTSLTEYTRKLHYDEIPFSKTIINSLISDLDKMIFIKETGIMTEQLILRQDLNKH